MGWVSAASDEPGFLWPWADAPKHKSLDPTWHISDSCCHSFSRFAPHIWVSVVSEIRFIWNDVSYLRSHVAHRACVVSSSIAKNGTIQMDRKLRRNSEIILSPSHPPNFYSARHIQHMSQTAVMVSYACMAARLCQKSNWWNWQLRKKNLTSQVMAGKSILLKWFDSWNLCVWGTPSVFSTHSPSGLYPKSQNIGPV